jgi:hypothetical protein
MGQAAAVLAVAVRARAARYMATAGRALQAARAQGQATLAVLAEAASPVVSAAGATISRMLEAVRDAASEVLSSGRAVAARSIPRALGQIGEAAESLWSAGERTAAGVFRRIVAGMALAYRGLAGAADALRAVAPTETSGIIRTSATTIRATLAAPGAEPGDSAEAASEALDQIEAAAIVHAPRTIPERLTPLTAAVETVRAELEEPQPDTPTTGAALDTIEALAPELIADEEARAAEAVQDSAAQEGVPEQETVPADVGAAPAWPASPVPSGAAGGESAHITEGERLDLVAYRYYAEPAYWRALAAANDIDDPLRLASGLVLRIPRTPESAA